MGAPVWHRDVESCEERMFEPSVRTEVDTLVLQVDARHRRLLIELSVRAPSDTTTRYDWRLLGPDGAERWAGTVPAGLPPDTTYAFEATDPAGQWLWVETRRTASPRYEVTHRPPRVSRRTRP